MMGIFNGDRMKDLLPDTLTKKEMDRLTHQTTLTDYDVTIPTLRDDKSQLETDSIQLPITMPIWDVTYRWDGESDMWRKISCKSRDIVHRIF